MATIKNFVITLILTPIVAILTAIVFGLLTCLVVGSGAIALFAVPVNLFNYLQQRDFDRRKLGFHVK